MDVLFGEVWTLSTVHPFECLAESALNIYLRVPTKLDKKPLQSIKAESGILGPALYEK